jgi:hypothetical protein
VAFGVRNIIDATYLDVAELIAVRTDSLGKPLIVQKRLVTDGV